MRHRDPAFAAHMAATARAAEVDEMRREQARGHAGAGAARAALVSQAQEAKLTIYPRMTAVYSEDGSIIVSDAMVERYHVMECPPAGPELLSDAAKKSCEVSTADRPDGFGDYFEAIDWIRRRLRGAKVYWMGFGPQRVEAPKIGE